jgi:tetratricopeptide (TPR) repeat protein
VLCGLGDLEGKLGRNDQARAAFGEALVLFKQEDNRLGQANVLSGLGDLERKLGRHDQARAAYGDALALYKQEDNRQGQANVLAGLGALERMLGRNDQARAAYGEASALYKQIDDRLGQANVLGRLGELAATDRPARPMARPSPFLSRSMTASARPMCSPGAATIRPARPMARRSPFLSRLMTASARQMCSPNWRLGGQARPQRSGPRGLWRGPRLFKQIDDRLGQAYVLARLGFRVSRENPQLAARYFFESAQLYEMIGMIEERDAALIEADKLYK